MSPEAPDSLGELHRGARTPELEQRYLCSQTRAGAEGLHGWHRGRARHRPGGCAHALPSAPALPWPVVNCRVQSPWLPTSKCCVQAERPHRWDGTHTHLHQEAGWKRCCLLLREAGHTREHLWPPGGKEALEKEAGGLGRAGQRAPTALSDPKEQGQEDGGAQREVGPEGEDTGTQGFHQGGDGWPSDTTGEIRGSRRGGRRAQKTQSPGFSSGRPGSSQ